MNVDLRPGFIWRLYQKWQKTKHPERGPGQIPPKAPARPRDPEADL